MHGCSKSQLYIYFCTSMAGRQEAPAAKTSLGNRADPPVPEKLNDLFNQGRIGYKPMFALQRCYQRTRKLTFIR